MKTGLSSFGATSSGSAAKTGLSLIRFVREHTVIGVLLSITFAFIIVVLLALFFQRIELQYRVNHARAAEPAETTPAKDSEERDIILPGSEESTLARSGAIDALLASAEATEWAAEFVSQSGYTILLQPGRAMTLEVKFKNTGTATWTRTGEHFAALNVTNPAGRQSVFRHAFWKEFSYRPTRLLEDRVAPGEIGTFRFAVQAPNAPGTYSEQFGLVAEDLLWIPGGETQFTFTVPNPYRAELLSPKNQEVTMDPGRAVTLELQFRNTGTATWTRTGEHFAALNVTNPSGRQSVFRHAFWKEFSYRPTRLLEDRVAPGEIGTFRFAVQAPLGEAVYEESYGLVAEDFAWMEGGAALFRFTVGRPAIVAASGEPMIRVGIQGTADPVQLVSTTAADAYAGSALLGQIPAETAVTITPQAASLQVTGSGIDVTTREPVRLVPTNAGIVTAASYEMRPAWNSAINYNQFRGVMEVRWSPRDEKHWLINEVAMEQYLAGIAETSTGNPPEYVKALIIAARSYAQYHINRGITILGSTTESTKHGYRGFHVHTTYDQVYRGYVYEGLAPDIGAAAAATRGLVVASNGEPVITPYYSHSDGRTRAWDEVWNGGPYPWLTSVPDPCCTNMELFGHGVGMSALGAFWFANEKGWTASQILSYYYTGTGLKQLY